MVHDGVGRPEGRNAQEHRDDRLGDSRDDPEDHADRDACQDRAAEQAREFHPAADRSAEGRGAERDAEQGELAHAGQPQRCAQVAQTRGATEGDRRQAADRREQFADQPQPLHVRDCEQHRAHLIEDDEDGEDPDVWPERSRGEAAEQAVSRRKQQERRRLVEQIGKLPVESVEIEPARRDDDQHDRGRPRPAQHARDTVGEFGAAVERAGATTGQPQEEAETEEKE